MSLKVIRFYDPYTSSSSNLMNSIVVDDSHVVYIFPTYSSNGAEQVKKYQDRLSKLIEIFFDGVTPTDSAGWVKVATFNNSSDMVDVTSKKNYTDFDAAVEAEQENVNMQYISRRSEKAFTPDEEEKVKAMTADFLHNKKKRETK
jgi:N-acetylmuramoyl-L-alanine amidase CwlA